MGAMTPIHGATASQRQAHERIRRFHTSPSYHEGRRHSLGAGLPSIDPLVDVEHAQRSAAQSKGKHNAAVLASRSRSSSSTQENDSVSDEETFFTPTKDRIQAIEKEMPDAMIGSTPFASPASSKSSRRNRDTLDLPPTDGVDASLGVAVTGQGGGAGDKEAKDPAAPKQPALGKRTHALRVNRGAKLMFSPLAVETKRTLAYEDEDEKDDEKMSERAANVEAKAAKEMK